MERSVRDWRREPLVHFLALGALLFGLYGWVGRAEARDGRPPIDITAADIDALQQKWAATWGRPPSAIELRRMVEDQVREEVLFREAMAMDLDRDDVVLRRRMVQKMEFLFQDVARLSEPTDTELAAFLAKSLDEYRVPARVSFTHVYFNPDRRGAAVEQDAAEVLARLRVDNPLRAPESGDRFLQPHDYAELSKADVGLLFGDAFAADLFGLSSDDWQGPVASSYGVHVMRVTAREEAKVPALAQVRDRVRQDFEAARRREANARMYASLRERYQVSIDETALSRSASSPVDVK